jgi:hypothetical protein
MKSVFSFHRARASPRLGGIGAMPSKVLIPILLGFLVAACQTTSPPELSVFKSDGCSCFPDGTLADPDLWKPHCRVHDYAYWKGGTCNERKQADLKLRDGIRSEGKPLTAQLAYFGVRIGGTPWLPTPWRWGFGWSGFPRGYRQLSDEEKRQIEKFRPPWISNAREGGREAGPGD